MKDNAAISQFFAVGLFLSGLLVSPSQLIEHMKKVWKVIGEMEASDLEAADGRKFILEFFEEGTCCTHTRWTMEIQGRCLPHGGY
jgi:hypothetical protein